MENLNKINNHIFESIDVFICSSSFEERSFVIADSIHKESVKQALICTNQDQKKYVGKNASQLAKRFNNSLIVNLSTDDPIKSVDSLIKAFLGSQKRKGQNILIDMTTFTHETLLVLLKIVCLYSKVNDKVQFIYNSAKSYCYNKSNDEDMWLSKGLKDKRNVLGYAGSFKPYQKLHFIVLVGYEIERAKHLIESLEPDLLSLALGRRLESINSNIYSVNKFKYENLKTIYDKVNEFDFSCIDPSKTRIDLLDYIDQYPNYNVVLSPMNNKISTLGCGLAAIKKGDIQILYSRANTYNTECYSEASDNFYLFELSDLLK